MTGRTISHYQVLDKLGEGGMGAVKTGKECTVPIYVCIRTGSTRPMSQVPTAQATGISRPMPMKTGT